VTTGPRTIPTTFPVGRGREITSLVTAEIVHDSFDRFYAEFHRITRDARRRFDTREWALVHDLHHQRIDLYQRYVTSTLGRLASTLRAFPEDLEVWRGAHKAYAELVRGRIDFEVAETFFNAITRKVFRTVGVNREIEFLERELETPDSEPLPGQIERVPQGTLVDMFASLLVQPRPAIHWRDLRRDAAWLAARYEEHCESIGVLPVLEELDVLRPLFFRTREGYIVGRGRVGERVFPVLVPIQPTGAGMVVDGALFDEASTLQVFSSTRSYFFVDVLRPVDVVGFLGSLMPRLTESELYIAIAHHRHGKTLIHRELVDYLASTHDPFIMAPGIAGLVMTVFTLPSYRNVFKVIRDKFDKPTATREGILRSYRDVFRGRRVGRLADTQEFEYLAFERRRFSEPCLNELLAKARSSIHVDGDEVIVSHLYIEEKMTPLNIYLTQVGTSEAAAAMIDYGDAIAELAANNIFAGDLLWKNFGVTGNGRLVLYDYDEICPLLACNFRRIPKARSYEDELSDQPYYAVADSDVFPEEWAPFIVPREPALRAAFLDHHAALLTPEFWQEKQAQVVANELNIGLPYAPRFPALSSPPRGA
jgi:isocitrate dehydrogenase kinase/phosphatase